jgi:hypothetical protein
MHLHNGNPLWCRPAPTKSGAIWSKEDELEETVELSELPRLIANAIKAGLVQRPAQEPRIVKPVASWQRASCEQCGAKYTRNHMRHVWCEACRNPPVPCVLCGTPFRKRHSKQTACSVECSKERQRASFLVMAESKRKPVKLSECIICEQMKPVRQAGGTFAKTCSKECAAVYRKQKGAEYKQSRATQK